MSGAPSCAVLGPDAAAVARRALRSAPRGAGRPLLIRWGCVGSGIGRGGAAAVGTRRERAALDEQVPEDWVVGADGSALTIDIAAGIDPSTARDDAALIASLIGEWAGPLALAVGVLRDDDVDAVLRIVDELVLVRGETAAVTTLAEAELQQLSPRVTTVDRPVGAMRRLLAADAGQSSIVAIAVIAAVLAVAVGLALVASALGRGAGMQGRADVAALAGAKALADGQQQLLGLDGSGAMTSAEYRARATRAVERSAAANRLKVSKVELLGDQQMPVRVRITATTEGAAAESKRKTLRATAEVVVAALPATSGTGDYTGPLAVRQGQRMRPDVAIAFDRMNAAARADGVTLVITSGFRSDAEQAVLFARNPDPKWVAPPGKSLHRLGTELDLGPAGSYGWLAANAPRFGFKKRYSWEPWHFGFVGNAGTTSLGYTAPSGGGERGAGSAVPAFVPQEYAALLAKAAQRWSVGAALLGAQLKAESNFNPRAVSPVGAAGIAQFMPATAAAYGLSPAERFDPAKAIDAQAHLMHDLLRQFGSVPLALAAYNAGPAPVQRCGCVPPYPETQAYVQKILAMLGGAGLSAAAGVQIRLVA